MNKLLILLVLGFFLLVEAGIAYWYVGTTCQACQPCEGWDTVNPICQIGYAGCTGGYAACESYVSTLRLMIVGGNLLIMGVVAILVLLSK